MRRFSTLLCLLACLVFGAFAPAARAESLSHGRFKNVQIYPDVSVNLISIAK